MTTRLSVLLAEDSEDDALLLERELRQGGFEPSIERVDTPKAMTARLDAGDWDIVLADYSMPKFNALEALAIVQDRGIDLPFIIVSGTIGEETAVAAMKAGAHDYLMKDNLARLVPAVSRELRDADERRARREAEEGLESAREKAMAQDRLAAVGQLAAGIAHDFNNILGSIALLSDLLLLHAKLAGENMNRLETIRDQAMRGASLVSQILDFGRRSILEKHPMDLEPQMRETEKLLARALPEDIQLEIHFGDDRLIVNAEHTRLQQVFINLALNARDAMPEGGKLTIKFDKIQVEEGLSPLRDMPPGMWMQAEVSDTGRGIPAEVLPRIFEPFFTTKERGEGTGLGLAQVHGIVKQHDGFIDVTSKQGTGTTFTIYLPALPDQGVPAVFPPVVTAEHGHGETILLVEDDEATRSVVAQILESLNYRVILASDGEDGMSIFQKQGEEIDLVITDRAMPSISGVELYLKLRELKPSVRIIMMTGYPIGDGTRELLERGAVTWIQKPMNSETLSRKVREALQT